MGLNFFKRNEKEVINSKEYESVSKKIVELFSEIENTKAVVRNLQTEYNNLRGIINKKLRGWAKEESERVGEDKSENINNSVILPYDGKPFKIGY